MTPVTTATRDKLKDLLRDLKLIGN
jgi:hypothetical protein